MVFEYPIQREAPYNGDKLLAELNVIAADIAFRTEIAGQIIVVSAHELPAQEEIDVTAVVENHDPSPTEEQSHQTSGRDALRDLLDNNADLLRYADYFFSRAKLLTAQHLPPRETSLTTLTTATVTLMEGDRATDTDHNAMWRLFLWKLRMKYAIFNTEDELPVLTAAQARNFLTEADSFIEWGRTTCHMLLLRNLI